MDSEEAVDHFETANGSKQLAGCDLGHGTSFGMVTITRVTEIHHCDCESRVTEDESTRKVFESGTSDMSRSSLDVTDIHSRKHVSYDHTS